MKAWARSFLLSWCVALTLGGCASVGRIVDGLPRGRFEELTYSRAGNTTTADIHLVGVVANDLYFQAESMEAVFTNPLLGKTVLRAKGYLRTRAGAPVDTGPPVLPALKE